MYINIRKKRLNVLLESNNRRIKRYDNKYIWVRKGRAITVLWGPDAVQEEKKSTNLYIDVKDMLQLLGYPLEEKYSNG